MFEGMSKQALYRWFSIPYNRNVHIKKLDKGLKHKNIKIKKDPEVENFTLDFLKDWKTYEKTTRLEFCEWIIAGSQEGQEYAHSKKFEIDEKIRNAGRSVKKKAKAAISVFTGKNKIGRNDPCPCGSGYKYKKCCMGKKDSE